MQRREFIKYTTSTLIAGALGTTAARADNKTAGEAHMAKVNANGITINYERQGTGEPLVLIPYLAADHACYAFQVADYAKHFTCISLDPRGTGETDKPDGTYSMELFADDVAAFMQAIGVERAHISGLSLGAATGLWLGGKYPERVKSLSLHSCWPKSDAFLKTVVEGWQSTAKGLNSVPEMIIQGILPWCFTPEFYSSNPEFMDKVAAFVRSRPKQPLDAFIREFERSDRPRCPRPAGPYQSPDADHLRPPRPSVRAALCRHADEGNRGERTCCVRDPARTHRSTKAPLSSTRRP